MTMSLFHIAQQAGKTAWLERFELFLHGFHIGRQRQLAAVIKDQVISRVDALQFEEVTHRGSQSGELCLI